jgi:anti-sigma factor RsiW
MTNALCPELTRTREAVRQRLSEEISPSSERALKAHLASCGVCAAESRALDPTLLFVPLGTSTAAAPSAEDVRRVLDDVLAEVRRRTRVSNPSSARPIFSRRFLQAAALVALAAGVFGVQGIRLASEKRGLSAGKTPTAAFGLVPDAEIADVGEVGSETVSERFRPSARPLIQDLKNTGARVYEFAAVSAKEPSVVFIADPHADL